MLTCRRATGVPVGDDLGDGHSPAPDNRVANRVVAGAGLVGGWCGARCGWCTACGGWYAAGRIGSGVIGGRLGPGWGTWAWRTGGSWGGITWRLARRPDPGWGARLPGRTGRLPGRTGRRR